MKKILGLDLGTNSIGWAVVNEAETVNETSSIVRLGVRVNPLTVDESQNFEKGKSIETNTKRTLKRSARRNLQRYKLRRSDLIDLLKKHLIINEDTILSEEGKQTTFETYKLRAKAAVEKIELNEFARVLLMINKKRGYKSSRKAKGGEEGQLVDGMEVARMLYDNDMTPGMLCFQLMKEGKKKMPDFYRSDLQGELDRVWNFQRNFYPELLTNEVKEKIMNKNGNQTWEILQQYFVWKELVTKWDEKKGESYHEEQEKKLVGTNNNKKGYDLKLENYEYRTLALKEKLEIEKLAVVLKEINNEIYGSSGYLGAISDRSKELYFNKETVGQTLYKSLQQDRHKSLKNVVFYRQDYLDEFEILWEKQAEYHAELTSELKQEVRDRVIFYQRRLKSQKSLISICEFERTDKVCEKDGKTKTIVIGSRVIPRSSPLFQEFKIWQTLNNVEVSVVGTKAKRKKRVDKKTLFEDAVDIDLLKTEGRRFLSLEEMNLLADELSVRDKMTKTDILKLLFKNSSGLDLNYKEVEGNRTWAELYKAFSLMIEQSGHEPIDFRSPAKDIKAKVFDIFSMLNWNTKVLDFDSSADLKKQDSYKLWHLLYSYEGDDSVTGDGCLINKLASLCNCDKEYAKALSVVLFLNDYGSLSAKAIRKILPYLKEGSSYDVACGLAGYRHSPSSLTKEEVDQKELREQLELLPKNSLRNPVVEKILNQMVNVVNSLMNEYGTFDEIRIELARELKKNQKEREALSKALSSASTEAKKVKDLLQKDFNIVHPTRNDVIRYRLYEELKDNSYKTLYSNTYIPREKLFSKDFDIEHIIPKARLFDDSFSNKTLESKDVNIRKANRTAYDFVMETYGEKGLGEYTKRCEALFKNKKTKLRNLLTDEKSIPDGFIERDLRNTQYITKRALSMLSNISRRVVATTGSVTDQLRKDWQLVDVMKELNWEKYKALGLVEYHQDHDGRQIGRIKDWTKRNDHRHHAMDALTVAFTKDVYVQYFNNKNASDQPNTNEYAIKNAYFSSGKAIAPIPVGEFRAEAKRHLENVLVSIKAKNKVVTNNINKIHSKQKKSVLQQTPRGQLHEETIYGRHMKYSTKEEKVGSAFDENKILTVCRQEYREALLWRLHDNGGDSKRAFTGKNSLDKNPIWLNEKRTRCVPIKVKTVEMNPVFTIRKPISPDLKLEKVVDVGIRHLLQERLDSYGGDAKKAFGNLEEKPIWINEEKGIKVKRIAITGIANGQAVHEKQDKEGSIILDKNGKPIPVDFVNKGNNHHVAIYRKPLFDKQGCQKVDENGQPLFELDECVVSFYEAVARVNQGLPIIDKEYKISEGWQLLYTMKQNEYFVFPNDKTGFDPKDIDLLDPENYPLISPNLFRVQKISFKNYVFRHHLETTIVDTSMNTRGVTWVDFRSSKGLDKIIKVRINHIGKIVAVGEY